MVVRLPTHILRHPASKSQIHKRHPPHSTMGHCYDETWHSQLKEPYLFIFIWEFLVGPRCCHSEINFRQVRMFLDQFLSICLIPQLKRCLTGSARQQKTQTTYYQKVSQVYETFSIAFSLIFFFSQKFDGNGSIVRVRLTISHHRFR